MEKPGPAADASVPVPGLPVAAVAKRLGIAPATLRTWDRRYGLGPSERTDGGHRRYTPTDIARLDVMRRLTLDGAPPADAARSALAAQLPRPGGSRPALHAITGGGQGVAAPVSPISQVVDAALTYDQAACDALLALDCNADPARWWVDLVEPARERIAERTVLGTPGEAPELVLASAVLGALRRYTRAYERVQVAAGRPPVNHPSRMGRLVLIFAPPEEEIPLMAHALAAALVAHGASARVVTGPASPHRAVELVTMVRPTALVLATSLARPDLGVVHAVHEAFEELPLLVAMREDEAATEVPLSPKVQRVRSFPGLVHETLAVAAH